MSYRLQKFVDTYNFEKSRRIDELQSLKNIIVYAIFAIFEGYF